MATAPRTDGLQLHVTKLLDPETDVLLFLHPGIIAFAALNVTFDAALRATEIVTGVL